MSSDQRSFPVPSIDRALAERALACFDATVAAHELTAELRPVLALAAMAYAAARQVNAPRPNLAGRDAVLANPYDGFDPVRRCVAASAVAFQRERLRRRREPAFLWLAQPARNTALRLSAILLLADALLPLPEAALQLRGLATETIIHVPPEGAALIAGQVAGERWEQYIGPLRIKEGSPTTHQTTPGSEPAPDAAAPWALLVTWTPVVVPLRLTGGEPLAEGMRRILRHQFEQLLARDAAVRAAEDAEEVHQFRVATRRLRASLQAVAPCFDPEHIRRFRRGLRRIAGALSAVRDRDVLLEHLHAYLAGLPESEYAVYARLKGTVEQDRLRARQTMLTHLKAARYERFKHALATFLTTPGAGVATPSETGQPARVRDAAGSLLWARYEALRAFEPVLLIGGEHVQHQARIAGKRLRYTIECFADVIGAPVAALLEPLAALQDVLGVLQDESTARAYLASLELEDDPGAQAYLAQRNSERAAHLAALPEQWARVIGPTYRGQLLAVLDAL